MASVAKPPAKKCMPTEGVTRLVSHIAHLKFDQILMCCSNKFTGQMPPTGQPLPDQSRGLMEPITMGKVAFNIQMNMAGQQRPPEPAVGPKHAGAAAQGAQFKHCTEFTVAAFFGDCNH